MDSYRSNNYSTETFTEIPPTTTVTNPSSAYGYQILIVVIICAAYPLLMLLLVVYCRKRLLRCGPYRGMTEEEILMMDQCTKWRLTKQWLRAVCCTRCCGEETNSSSAERQSQISTISESTTEPYTNDYSCVPPPYDVALGMAKPEHPQTNNLRSDEVKGDNGVNISKETKLWMDVKPPAYECTISGNI